MIGQFTPALRATADVAPFRLVSVTPAARNEGTASANGALPVVGVSDGSNRRFDSALHALAGEPIRMQPGQVVQVEAGAAITAGDLITPGAAGVALASTTPSDIKAGQALEDAAEAAEIIRIVFRPELTVT